MADPEVDLFAGMKKKKKKTVVLDLDEEEAPAPVEETKPITSAAYAPAPISSEHTPAPPVDDTPVQEQEKPAEDGADLFADLKKKKKKKKEIPLDLEAVAPESSVPGGEGLDVPIKKKKSKKQATDFAKEVSRFKLRIYWNH